MGRRKEWESLLGRMGRNIRVLGRMVYRMGKEL